MPYRPIESARLQWRDGAPYSEVFEDVYFSPAGGLAETRQVFLQGNDLPQRWQGREDFVVAETGFGTGLNFLATAALWLQQGGHGRLHYVAVEGHPLRPCDLARALAAWPQLGALAGELRAAYPQPNIGFHRCELAGGRVVLTLILDQVDQALAQLQAQVDAWYLDGFAPRRNPAMWQSALFQHMAALSAPQATFATYTAASQVRRGLADAGFAVTKRPGFGGKREMLHGTLQRPATAAGDPPWFAPPPAWRGERRALVIGGGLAGCALADALGRRQWQVTLLERHGAVAQAASGNRAGVLRPYLTADMSREALFHLHAFLYASRRLTALDAWHPTGVLQAMAGPRARQMAELGLPAEVVSAVDAAEAQALAGLAVTQGGLHYPSAGWADPPAVCRALMDNARADTLFHHEALALCREQAHWRVESQGKGIIRAPVVIIANAQDALRLPPVPPLPLQRVRGQVAHVAATPETARLRLPVCGEGYITPASAGMHCVGATFDPDDHDPRCRTPDEAAMLRQARTAVPAFATATAHGGRVGFRTMSLDHLPLAGALHDAAAYRRQYGDLAKGRPGSAYPRGTVQPGLYLSLGHGARGLGSALMAAELIASLVTAEPLPLPRDLVQAVHPARFLIRQLRRGRE